MTYTFVNKEIVDKLVADNGYFKQDGIITSRSRVVAIVEHTGRPAKDWPQTRVWEAVFEREGTETVERCLKKQDAELYWALFEEK